MKKLLLSLFVVSAISSLAAGDFNVYGKFGVDLNSAKLKMKMVQVFLYLQKLNQAILSS